MISKQPPSEPDAPTGQQDRCRGCGSTEAQRVIYTHLVQGFCVDCRDDGRHRSPPAQPARDPLPVSSGPSDVTLDAAANWLREMGVYSTMAAAVEGAKLLLARLSSGQDKEAVENEPVAWIHKNNLMRLKENDYTNTLLEKRVPPGDEGFMVPLYTHAAPQPSPLSWEEAQEKVKSVLGRAFDAGWDRSQGNKAEWSRYVETDKLLSALGFSHPSQPKP